MLTKKSKSGILLLTILILLTGILVGPQITLADEHKDKEVEIPEVDTEKKRLVLASDAFRIKINGGGEVPFYHFNTTNPEYHFFLKLQQIVQYKDNNDNEQYDPGELVGGSVSTLQLTSVDWDLEMITESSDLVEFGLVASQIRNPLFAGTTLELVHSFSVGSTAIKFDVNITNWPFVEAATGLSLEFELSWGSVGEDDESGSQLTKESTETGIFLKTATDDVVASFESVAEVTIDGTTIADGAKLNDTANTNAPKLNIFLNYPKFETSLFHDPTFGSSVDVLTGPTAIVLWLQENVKDGFLGLTVITTLVLGTLFVVNRRKR
jgi:hypothetical protein